MNLQTLLEGIEYDIIAGDVDKDVSGLYYDSRKVVPNSVFVAMKGGLEDGHQYINRTILDGCTVVVGEFFEGITCNEDGSTTLIQVDDSRKALALLSANYYGHPSRQLNLIGLTGTNGKTSTAMYLSEILKTSGEKVGIIGTTGIWIGNDHYETKNTTPESAEVQRILAQMVKEKVSFCVMEVSSHALEMHRVTGCAFKASMFSNLTPDHLELHGTMENYFNAKAKLFQMTAGKMVINQDDSYGRRLIDKHMNSVWQYGFNQTADIFPTDLQETVEGSKFTLNMPIGKITVAIAQPGRVNVYNAMSAAGIAASFGIPIATIKRGLETVKQIKGRFELVYKDEAVQVLVDFAHTEDGLAKAIETLKPFVKNRLCLVFGVYAPEGQPGIDKRKGMATVAAHMADFSVVTSDNPKFQDPVMIVEDICKTMALEKAHYKAIVDREEAIKYALSQLESGDILLIAGKGHETAQVIAGVEYPFNEKEIVCQYMKQHKKS